MNARVAVAETSERAARLSTMMEAVVLPDGTVTFLLSDVEGSIRGRENAPEAVAAALSRSSGLVEDAVAVYGGYLPVEHERGDSRLAVFERAADALAAAMAIQRAHASETWPDGARLRVRVALHAADARFARRGHLRGTGCAPGGSATRARSGRADPGLWGSPWADGR